VAGHGAYSDAAAADSGSAAPAAGTAQQQQQQSAGGGGYRRLAAAAGQSQVESGVLPFELRVMEVLLDATVGARWLRHDLCFVYLYIERLWGGLI